MDISRLRTLRELSLRKTMAAAAAALLVSPSAVSQQIAQLEMETGVPLVERRGRGVRLTSAGETLVRHAQTIIAVLDEARTDLAATRTIVGGEIRVAAFPSIATALIPQTMRALRAAHPGLQVTLEEMEPAEGLAALRAWQADVAVIDDLTLPAEAPVAGVETIALMEDALYAMLPAAHPLAGKPSIGLADLRDEAWAMDSAPKAYSRMLVRHCRSVGFTPTVNGACNGFEVVVALVEAGCSVSVMPGLRVRSYRGNFVARRIAPEIRRRIEVAFRRGALRNPAVAAFVTELRFRAKALVEASPASA